MFSGSLPPERLLQGEVSQLSQRVREIGDEVATLRQVCDSKVEQVLFEREGLHVCLHLTTPQHLEDCSSIKALCGRLELHRGHAAAGLLRLESLLASSVSGFIGRLACLVRNEVHSHRARFKDVFAPASETLELD